MVEGLFLDGIHILADSTSVDQGVKGSIYVLTHLANPQLPRGDDTAMTAQVTAHPFVIQFVVKHGFFHHGFLFIILQK